MRAVEFWTSHPKWVSRTTGSPITPLFSWPTKGARVLIGPSWGEVSPWVLIQAQLQPSRRSCPWGRIEKPQLYTVLSVSVEATQRLDPDGENLKTDQNSSSAPLSSFSPKNSLCLLAFMSRVQNNWVKLPVLSLNPLYVIQRQVNYFIKNVKASNFF